MGIYDAAGKIKHNVGVQGGNTPLCSSVLCNKNAIFRLVFARKSYMGTSIFEKIML